MPNTKPKMGRPPSTDGAVRYMLRHDPEQREIWNAAAATCGMSLQAWIAATLDGEAKKATHVPIARRIRRG